MLKCPSLLGGSGRGRGGVRGVRGGGGWVAGAPWKGQGQAVGGLGMGAAGRRGGGEEGVAGGFGGRAGWKEGLGGGLEDSRG